MYHTETTRIWIICYNDNDIRPDGVYYSSQLHIRCNGKKIAQVKHKFGGESSSPKNLNFVDRIKVKHDKSNADSNRVTK